MEGGALGLRRELGRDEQAALIEHTVKEGVERKGVPRMGKDKAAAYSWDKAGKRT